MQTIRGRNQRIRALDSGFRRNDGYGEIRLRGRLGRFTGPYGCCTLPTSFTQADLLVAQVTVIGTGLIGTSLGLALRASSLRNLTVVGTDADSAARSGAQRKDAFDRVEGRLGNAIAEADIIVLATPVLAMRELLDGMADYLPEGCVVTDVGSTKTQVLQWADEYLPDSVDFVGGHPMAGRETPGPENADGTMFSGKPYCVIPSPRASERAVGEISTLAEAVGAVPYFISVDEHDSFVAAVSHLPFVLSTALVGCTSKSANWSDIGQLASSGYRDITRLASGDPIMHRDICISNAQPIVAWIDAFIRELYEYRKLLDTDGEPPDTDAVGTVFEDAMLARNKWMAGGGEPAIPRAGEHSGVPDVQPIHGPDVPGRLRRPGPPDDDR